MPDLRSRRAFLTGALTTGVLSAAGIYGLRAKRDPSTRAETLTITLLSADETGARQHLVNIWNDLNPEIEVKLTPVGGGSLDHRIEMEQAAKQGDADILNLDIIHVLEFAHKELIQPIPVAKPDGFFKATLIPSKSTPGRYWAAPVNTDVGMLFSRRGDHPSADPPSMQQALEEVKAGSQAFVAQLKPGSAGSHEAFVVNVLEHALAVKSQVLDGRGVPSFDVELWRDALKPLKQAIDSRRILPAPDEGTSREEFTKRPEDRKYMRNWPTQYHLTRYDDYKQNTVADIRVSPLPTGILGGQSLAVARKTKHYDAAVEVINFLTDDSAQKVLAAHGFASARSAVYNDAALIREIPHLPQLRIAIDNAIIRPLHWNYRRFSEHIWESAQGYLINGIDLHSSFGREMEEILSS